MKKSIFTMLLLFLLLPALFGCTKKNEIKLSDSPALVEEQTADKSASDEESDADDSNSDQEIAENEDEQQEEIETDATPELKPKKETVESESIKQETPQAETPKDTEVASVVETEPPNALKIEGNVGNKVMFTLEELKAMDSFIFEADFFSLNSYGTKGYTHFKGINLWSLLNEKAQISQDASKIMIVATDGYEMAFTLEQVKRQDYIDEQNSEALYPMIIAWEENGEEYDVSEGAPYKLVVGQTEPGDVNKPQWVSNIDKIIIE